MANRGVGKGLKLVIDNHFLPFGEDAKERVSEPLITELGQPLHPSCGTFCWILAMMLLATCDL